MENNYPVNFSSLEELFSDCLKFEFKGVEYALFNPTISARNHPNRDAYTIDVVRLSDFEIHHQKMVVNGVVSINFFGRVQEIKIGKWKQLTIRRLTK